MVNARVGWLACGNGAQPAAQPLSYVQLDLDGCCGGDSKERLQQNRQRVLYIVPIPRYQDGCYVNSLHVFRAVQQVTMVMCCARVFGRVQCLSSSCPCQEYSCQKFIRSAKRVLEKLMTARLAMAFSMLSRGLISMCVL